MFENHGFIIINQWDIVGANCHSGSGGYNSSLKKTSGVREREKITVRILAYVPRKAVHRIWEGPRHPRGGHIYLLRYLKEINIQ